MSLPRLSDQETVAGGRYHQRYWSHPDSSFVRNGVFALRIAAGYGLRLMGATLHRIHPALPGGSELIATASSQEEWREMVAKHFFLELDDLSEQEHKRLWQRVSVDHERWVAGQGKPKL